MTPTPRTPNPTKAVNAILKLQMHEIELFAQQLVKRRPALAKLVLEDLDGAVRDSETAGDPAHETP